MHKHHKYLIACVVTEIILLLMQYVLLIETLDSIGIEISLTFADETLLKWLFWFLPELSAKHLMGLVGAVFFVFLPVIVWHSVLFYEAEEISEMHTGGKIVVGLFSGAYLLLLVGEFLMILHRIDLAANGPFTVVSGNEKWLAFFFSLLFVVINTSVACATAYFYHEVKTRKAQVTVARFDMMEQPFDGQVR